MKWHTTGTKGIYGERDKADRAGTGRAGRELQEIDA